MKKITIWLFTLFAFTQMNAQLWTINTCVTSTSTAYGPMYSTTTANANNRMAVIYPSSQLSTLVGQTLNSIYFKRATSSGAMTAGANFKIYVKEVTATGWGSGALDWATATTGATLVYDSDPSTIVGNTAGWKSFPFSTNFVYTGTQNLAVFFEYYNPTASTSITWEYEYFEPCIDGNNTNSSKYNNNTTGTLATSLASSNVRRPVIGFDFITTCYSPTTLNTSNLTPTTADIIWTVNSAQPVSSFEYYNSTSSASPYPTTIPTGTTATGVTSVTLSSLSPGTTYYTWVRSDCGTDGKSIWIGPAVYTTVCVGVPTFTESFDSTPTGTGNLPNCWSKLGTSSNVYVSASSSSAMSAPNRLYMNISATTTAYAVMPFLSNLTSGTHRLRFKVYCSTTNKAISVGYFSTPGDVSTYIEINQFPMQGTNVASTEEFIVTPVGIPAGVDQLAFSIPSGVSTTLYIDDVIWEAIPSCIDPDASSFATNLITNNSATISWVEAGTATQWEIEYGAPGFTQGSGTVVAASTNPFVLTGLTANTNYDYYIRAICSTTDLSPWAGPSNFKTQCDDVTAFIEDFEGYATGTSNPLPDCWGELNTGTANSYITTGATAPMSPSNRLYMSASGTIPTETCAVLPPVSNLQANTHRLKFKAYSTSAGRFLVIGYLLNPNDLTTFIQLEEVNIPGTSNTDTQELTVIPSGIPAGVKHLAIKNAGHPLGTTIAYVDDVIWEPIPSCLEPNAVSFAANLITNNSANISWIEAGTATQWEIEYGASGFTQGSGTIITASTNPFVLTGLMSDTVYDYYIRSVCSTTDSSTWSGPSVFRTQCDAVTEFSENFDSYPTGTTNPLPDCWNKAGTSNAYIATGATAPMSPSNRMYMFGNGSVAPPTVSYAIMPAVSNLQANTHRLRFMAVSSLVDRVLQVGYLTDPSDVNTYVQLDEIILPAGVASFAQSFTIVPGALPAGVKNLCFRNPGISTASTTLYIDDVIWEAIPACPEPTTLMAANITSNSAELSWTEMGTTTTWNIEYGPTGFTQGSGTLISGVNTNPYILGSLTSSVTYDFYVQADCGSTNGTSTWTGPYTFTTLCVTNMAPYFQNFDSLPLVSPYTDMPNCWEAQTGPDYWDVTNDVINVSHTYLPNIGDHTTGTSNYMWIDSSGDIAGNEMVTPLIDMSGLTSPYAGFWFASNNTDNAINHTIALDVWDGAAWLNIAMQTGNFTTWVEVGAAVPTTVPLITKFRIYAIANPAGTATDYYFNDLGVDDFFVVENTTASVDNFDVLNFKAYPNPVNDILNLSYSSEITSIRVINLLGQELISKTVNSNSTQIDMSTLSTGTYIVNVVIDNTIKTIKINKK
ncbi:T9SS type A sorting domain-containing protein [uncultured Flavobacterium sp.]|uniref:fibronectin type III domain-containing protein n=1 Tax=uncultured Flavobacterium sp. TaxID=165435 RepID=UPI0030C7A609